VGSSQLLLLRPSRVDYQRILSIVVLDDQQDLTAPYLKPRRENAAARVQGSQACITQHDTLARMEQHRVPIRLLARHEFSAHAEGDHQWLALVVRSGAVGQGETLLQALRSVQVPLGEISPLVLQTVAVSRQRGALRLAELIAV